MGVMCDVDDHTQEVVAVEGAHATNWMYRPSTNWNVQRGTYPCEVVLFTQYDILSIDIALDKCRYLRTHA